MDGLLIYCHGLMVLKQRSEWNPKHCCDAWLLFLAHHIGCIKLCIHRKWLFFCISRSLREFSQWIVERIGSSLMNSLEVGAFFLQFLEWFYTSNTTPRSIIAQPIPPPPQVLLFYLEF